MAELRDVMAYICQRYPFKHELTKGRLTKLIYLADWESALETGHQVTRIEWQFNHFGPYVSDVVDLARKDSAFCVVPGVNSFGATIEIISLVPDVEITPKINLIDKLTMDRVIEQVEAMPWTTFISHVYATYPISTRPRYSQLDLPALAKEYRMKAR